MQCLDQAAIDNALRTLPGWKQDGGAIRKDFKLRDFNEATGFLMRVALLSEKLNHHAAYSGIYNKLSLTLTTHDAGGITERDIRMAAAVDQLAG